MFKPYIYIRLDFIMIRRGGPREEYLTDWRRGKNFVMNINVVTYIPVVGPIRVGRLGKPLY